MSDFLNVGDFTTRSLLRRGLVMSDFMNVGDVTTRLMTIARIAFRS
ncbi:MAG: hypothetical protein HY292_04575 [Planctomycetes bacterium]|nr:hypothetical protein [Planctomycetota bacterium]